MKTSHPPARRNRFPLLHLVLAGVLLFWGSLSVADAASFTVSPVLGDIPASSGIAVFEIHNGGARPLPVQVQAFAWTQPDGEDVRAPARDLVVVPPIATIPPGETQLVRIALRGQDRSREHAYRVLIRELPGEKDAKGSVLRTLLAFDVPLFFAAEDSVRELAWSLRRDGNTFGLRVTSNGSRYARFGSIRLLDKAGRELAALQGPLYVLAGATRTWPLPAQAAAKLQEGAQVRLVHTVDGEETAVSLTVE